MNLILVRFNLDCGRNGNLVGTFATSEKVLNSLIGKEIYFGECLGKHSDVSSTMEENMFEVLCKDQDFIASAQEYGLIPSGYNPIDYL